MGRAHFALAKPNLSPCPKCKTLKPPHQVCLTCGFFKGKEELAVLEKLDKRERKKREKVLKQTEGA